jgi:GTP pyrophosphokinase
MRRRHLSLNTQAAKLKLERAAQTLLHADSVDDLYMALASRRVALKQLLDLLAPPVPPAVSGDTKAPAATPVAGVARSTSGVYVDGLDMPANLAMCCSPVRGDDVIGYVTRGRGVSVHRVDCPNVKHLMTKQSQRFVNVTWDAPSGELFPVDFEIIGVDRPGLLKDVLDVIAAMNKSANRVSADVQSASSARIHFRIDVKDQAEIEHVRENVLRIPDVTRIYRSRPGLKA